MNKTGTIVTWGIVILLIAIGIIWYASYNSGTGYNATSTSTTTSQYGSGNSQVAGAPVAVTKNEAGPSMTAAIVLGTVNPNGADTKYWFEFGTSASLGSNSDTQSIGGGFMSIAAYQFLTGLKQNTTYYYRLVAENSFGRNTGNTYTFKTTNTANPVGKKPSIKTLDASGITKDAVKISGEINPNGAVTSYWFEYGKTSDLGNTTTVFQDGSGTDKVDVSTTLSNLDSNTTYYFRVDAYNQFGVSLGSVLSFKTSSSTGINSPTVTASPATNITNVTVTLNGKIDPNGADSQYWFEYSTDSLFGSILIKRTDKISILGNSGMANVSANVTSLKNNTVYYFRLVGQNSVGTSKSERMTFQTGTGSSSNGASVNTSGSLY